MSPSRRRAVFFVALTVVLACGEGQAPPFSAGGAGGAGGAGTAGTGGAQAASGAPASGSAGVSGAPLGGSGGNAGGLPGAGGAPAGGAPGASGAGGDAALGGASGASTGGAGSNSAGAAGAAGAAGGAGAAAASGNGGGAGASGSGGSGGSAGASGARCPVGPFEAPMVLSTADICEDFDLRYTWNEGPTWVESQQAFFFTNFVARSGSGGDIIKYTPGGACETFIADVGCNGLAVSNDGGLLAACQQTRSVVRFDFATKQPATIASLYMGTMLDTPNDLVQHTNGSIYFTNPTFELDGRPTGVGPGAFRIDPNGALSLIAQGTCNGIALSPDQSKLYVIQLGTWDLDAQGTPSNRANAFASGDGMGVDCAGNVWANGTIFDPGGEEVGSFANGTNLAFGGEDGMTVLLVGRGTPLRELRVNVPGLP